MWSTHSPHGFSSGPRLYDRPDFQPPTQNRRGDMAASREEVFERVKEVLTEQLGIEEGDINEEASFQEDLDILKAGTVEKQEPFAAVLSCADSRVPVELVFDQSIGHVFVTRVAGNVATPEIMASLEYGAVVLGTRAIVVLAHQGCGAVKAAIAGTAVPGQISALYRPLRPAVEQGGSDVEAVAKANAKIQADLLATASPVLADMIAKGTLKIVAAYYALATGKVTVLG